MLTGLLLVEGLLQGISLSVRRNLDVQRNVETDSFRILCLGESTTAAAEDPDHSWPTQLEKKLNSLNPSRRIQVINKGVTCTNTAVILGKLPTYLDHYRPDLVIAMIGINDKTWYGNFNQTRLERTLLHFRTYKFLRFACAAFFGRDERRVTSAKNIKIVPEGQAEDYSDCTDPPPGTTSEQVAKLEAACKRAIAGNPEDQRWGHDLADIYKSQGRIPEAHDVLQDLISQEVGTGLPQTDFVLEFRNTQGTFSPTTGHYRLIHQILSSRGIPLICMQYPTLDVNDLVKMFDNPDDVLFISNTANFQQALSTGAYSDYFRDQFMDTWGHCTAKGDELIAENLSNSIMTNPHYKLGATLKRTAPRGFGK